MRAQASTEFLLNFAITLALIAFITASLLSLGGSIGDAKEKYRMRTMGEESARMLDAFSSSGSAKSTGASFIEKNLVRENNTVLYDYNGRFLVLETIYGGSGGNAEAI
jgi:hypothetical protein